MIPSNQSNINELYTIYTSLIQHRFIYDNQIWIVQQNDHFVTLNILHLKHNIQSKYEQNNWFINPISILVLILHTYNTILVQSGQKDFYFPFLTNTIHPHVSHSIQYQIWKKMETLLDKHRELRNLYKIFKKYISIHNMAIISQKYVEFEYKML